MDEDPHRDICCIDIVFITDGHSNGPLDVYEEMDNSRLQSDQKYMLLELEITTIWMRFSACQEVRKPTFSTFKDLAIRGAKYC